MPRDTAQARVKAGKLDATTVTIDRPVTEVRGPSGDLFTLPRRPSEAGVVVYHKVNGRVVDPRTGHRLKRGNRGLASKARPQTVSFGAVALTAFIGFRVAQLLTRLFRRERQPSHLQQQFLLQQQLEQQQQQALPPPVRVMPAMLQRALPQLGPPTRVKRLAQAHKARQRRIPNAQQKMQTSGVAHKKPTTLEKWDKAVRQQAQALMVQQQSSCAAAAELRNCSSTAALLPLPGLPGSGALPPQPLFEVAEAVQQHHA